jgi:protoporphyrinogen oxidase
MDSREHFGVVGGGLLGLTLALRLKERGCRVTVLEARDHVGGLADAWQLGDVTWDRHYHVTLLSDSHLRGLLRELGLDEQLRWTKTGTGFLVDGRLHSMSNVLEFLRFPPLRLIDKLRLGWTIWHASRVKNWRRLENIPVGEWLIRHSGRRTFERIWLPLLKAKLGDAWQRTSAAFIWATIQRMYAARHSGQKVELFGYLPGGYGRMLTVFEQRLRSLGVEIRTNCGVARIERTPERIIEVETMNGETLGFDRVIVTTPSPVAAKVCQQLTAAESARLASIEYSGIVCASVLLKKPLSNYYVTNVTDPAPFTGVIEMTALVDREQLSGHSLVYLPKYATAGEAIWSLNDEQIQAEFAAALARLYLHFSPSDVLAFRVSRVKHVFALSTLGYSSRVPSVETSVPGLYVVNSSQIVNGTLNVNETVRLAESSIATLCKDIAESSPPANSLPVRPLQSLATNAAAHRELVARLG